MGDIHDELREVMGLLGKGTPDWRAYPHGVIRSGQFHEYVNGSAQLQNAMFTGEFRDEDRDAALAAVNFLRQHGPALLAAAKYEEANPLGGPATMLEAAARRIRAGEDFHEVLADYGLLARQEGEDARDADRYRWLKANFQADYCRSTSDYWRITGEHDTPQELHIGNGELTLDYLVDAARSGGGD